MKIEQWGEIHQVSNFFWPEFFVVADKFFMEVEFKKVLHTKYRFLHDLATVALPGWIRALKLGCQNDFFQSAWPWVWCTYHHCKVHT